jgi:hypothetical protein
MTQINMTKIIGKHHQLTKKAIAASNCQSGKAREYIPAKQAAND